MTATQAHHPRALERLRKWFKSRTSKKMSRKDLFTDAAMAGAAMRSYMVMPGQPVWMDRNYYQFALEAYIKNVIAHRAMGMVSGAAASVPLRLYERGADGIKVEITSHPILDMLAHPNPTQAHGEFFQALHQYRLISGNAFIKAVGPTDTLPRELHLLRPDRMAVIAGKGTMPAGYRYTVNGDYTDYPVDRLTGRSQILHLKNFHPLNDWYGLSPVEAAAYSIDQHNQAGAWNQALLQNGARPSGALVVNANSTGSGTLSEDQYNRIKLQIDDQFTGAVNAGRPILLEGGLDWKEMSITPRDMDFVQAKNSAARDIALAFGVPPQMLGIPGDNTYSNLQEARLALWEQTVLPLVKNTIDALNGWLTPMFGSQFELVMDTSHISALAIKNQAMWNMVETANFLTINEKRAAVGYGTLEATTAKKKVKILRELKIGRHRVVKDWFNGSDDDDEDDDNDNSSDNSDNNDNSGDDNSDDNDNTEDDSADSNDNNGDNNPDNDDSDGDDSNDNSGDDNTDDSGDSNTTPDDTGDAEDTSDANPQDSSSDDADNNDTADQNGNTDAPDTDAPYSTPGGVNYDDKIKDDMQNRDWTPEQIDEAKQYGDNIDAQNKTNGEPFTDATRYVHPETGASVVIDDATNQVVQVGQPDFIHNEQTGDAPGAVMRPSDNVWPGPEGIGNPQGVEGGEGIPLGGGGQGGFPQNPLEGEMEE